ANIGTPTGIRFWVVDEDPRASGDTTLLDLQRRYGPLPRTLTSHTGGGGRHLFWELPAGRTVINKIRIGLGGDILAAGSYVILPPSVPPLTANNYVFDIIDGPDDIPPQPAPDWLLDLVTQPSSQGTPQAQSSPVDDPIFEGERDNTLMHYGVAMAHAGLGEA